MFVNEVSAVGSGFLADRVLQRQKQQWQRCFELKIADLIILMDRTARRVTRISASGHFFDPPGEVKKLTKI